MSNLKTAENRSLLRSFLEEAKVSCRNSAGGIPIERLMFRNGRFFEVSDQLAQAKIAIEKAIRKALGPVKGHSQDIDRILWSEFENILDKGEISEEPEVLNSILENIEFQTSEQIRYVRPCGNVRLPIGVDSIEIGPVSIFSRSRFISQLERAPNSLKPVEANEWSLSILVSQTEAGIHVGIPPAVWHVQMIAAEQTRPEHGGWLVDVALSLLRLAVPSTELGHLYPFVGLIEDDPFAPANGQHNSMTLFEDGSVSVGGVSAPNLYILQPAALSRLAAQDAREKIRLVFEGSDKSLSQRFHQGCGWLTRGRRSLDRSNRLLYFFTAIEALLSDTDKSAPVVQTIARHAAVLLSDDNKRRVEIARQLRNLYGLRSALVHTGKRGVHQEDANSAQIFAEALFNKVWKDANLSMPYANFLGGLSKGSYGLKFEELF